MAAGAAFQCITDGVQFNAFRDFTGERTCNILSQSFVDNKLIVGPVEEGGCGDGDTKVFVERTSQFIEDILQVLRAVTIGLSEMMLLIVVTAC